MRNDANDDFDNVPSLRADTSDDDDFEPTPATSVRSRPAPVVKVKSASTGPLWALVGALLFAFAGLAWWSFQQISLMGQQLVATQESFARISEEAAGRLQDISGKVVASEANVNNGSEALKLQIKQLETQLLEQGKQQMGVAGQATDLDKRLEQMTASTTQLSSANAQLQGQVQALTEAVATLKSRDAEFKDLSADVAALKKQGNPRPPSPAWSRTLWSSRANWTTAPRLPTVRPPKSSTCSASRPRVTSLPCKARCRTCSSRSTSRPGSPLSGSSDVRCCRRHYT